MEMIALFIAIFMVMLELCAAVCAGIYIGHLLRKNVLMFFFSLVVLLTMSVTLSIYFVVTGGSVVPILAVLFVTSAVIANLIFRD